MRKIFYIVVLSVLSLNLISCGTAKRMIETPPQYNRNIENQFDKNTNYINANEWMVNTFNSAKSVIQFKDKEAGIIKGKYLMKEKKVSGSYNIEMNPNFYAIITIRVKDNKTRIEIDPPSNMFTKVSMGIEYGFTPKMFNGRAKILSDSFEKQMKEGISDGGF